MQLKWNNWKQIFTALIQIYAYEQWCDASINKENAEAQRNWVI